MALVNLAQKYDPRIVADKERIKQVRLSCTQRVHTYIHTYIHTYVYSLAYNSYRFFFIVDFVDNLP